MRRIPFAVLAVLASAVAWTAPRAAEPRCSLDVEACLRQFENLKDRPWMGVYVHTDSLGRRVIASVVPGSPADRAGVKPGDALQRIGGMAPADWYASRAGWKSGDRRDLVVLRDGRTRDLTMECQPISDELFARIVGEHMIHGHMAYMHEDDAPRPH